MLARTVHHLQSAGTGRGGSARPHGGSGRCGAAIAKAAQLGGMPSPADLITRAAEKRSEVTVLAVAVEATDEAGATQDLPKALLDRTPETAREATEA
ncbi:hypothetical protein Ari01nite_95950 [Paractinoplanes rishiriensis]|uniref:Uncharacterized protein n=2 Tax=Paractinoplanes rishiriensis TaxID=1050105 RepID=A0A919KAY3_9ACTN|nr:hypothetical protein Ari01nite_95950 [Actinoplanes rishiriensis]